MADTGSGAKRATVCPACEAEVAPAAKFCSSCGASLARPPSRPFEPSRPGPEAERRPVTILFTDIVGSTAIAERLDPEEWREVVSGAHRCVTDAVVRYEGTIAQLLGDGVLAFFGAPIAHEDDPARAVRAALDIQAAMAAYARDLRGYVDDFAMRIGIHTGEVVVGEVAARNTPSTWPWAMR